MRWKLLLDDRLQELTTDTCGIFQLYFYKNLFDPNSDSKMFNDEFLTENTVTTLLNENFSTNKETNKEEMKLFAEDNNMWLCL